MKKRKKKWRYKFKFLSQDIINNSFKLKTLNNLLICNIIFTIFKFFELSDFIYLEYYKPIPLININW